jgi:lipopolysaccharide export system protein LptA
VTRAASLAVALLLGSSSAAADEAAAELAALAIGVAPFERAAAPGQMVPDLAAPLAARILARGVGRTVAPPVLAGEGVAEPPAARVVELAREHGLTALVVGRITRLGARASLDVRLRDGRTGAIAGTYVAEVPVNGEPGPALDPIASQVVARAVALAQVQARAQASAPTRDPRPPAAKGQLEGRAVSAAPPVLSGLDASEPFSISSGELEVEEGEGVRMLTFRSGVEARQGDLLLRTARLQATYPEGAKHPETLVALGGVEIRQGDRSARCQRADYLRSEERIVCRGDAVLRDGEDELRGESIVFDLAGRRVTVEGGTQLAVTPEADERAEGSRPLGELAGAGPVSIRADQLEGIEEASGARRIRFEGSVEVTQEDLVLHAREIEAVYPPGAREPETLVATGGVRVLQPGREARCERAVYHAGQRRVECSGQASLRKDRDTVTGEAIEFDLASERLVVSGGTRLTLAPREDGETVAP